MKKIIFLLAILFSLHAAAQSKAPAQKASTNKYNDNIDDRMKGPHGEKVYIGPNGGRYYIKHGKKIYIVRKANKRKN